jgi:hypothetical protein
MLHDPDAQKLRRYGEMLAKVLTPDQAAHCAEQWELICAQEGWLNFGESPAANPAAPQAVTLQPPAL